ncbi:MAG: glycoside hydrolase family 32 protein [Armatimonadota bacterium]
MTRTSEADVVEQLREERQKAEQHFKVDPHRPRYHFLPRENWMNDPNGPIWFDGQYHLFYQFNPNEAKWGDIHWGHAVSPDLVHWEDWPVALAPETEGVDEGGCFTGCAFVNDGTPTIAYTGITLDEDAPRGRAENQSLAVSRDGMLTWQKIAENPVIARPPEGLNLTGFRDPCVWRERNTWYMLIGAGIDGAGEGGTALLYRSTDLIDWEYLHPLLDLNLTPPLEKRGDMWECPDFFPLSEHQVLLISTLGTQRYISGGWSAGRFLVGHEGRVDHGPSFYAGKSFEDAHGRRVLWGWLREARTGEAQRAAGWSGVMSLPRVLTILPDGGLGQAPAEELKRLRGEAVTRADIDLQVGEDLPLEIEGRCIEIEVEVDLKAGARFVLSVLTSPRGEERTEISYDARQKTVGIDTTQSSLGATAESRDSAGPLELPPGESLRLRVFVDRSVVEVFANGRACVTERAYPTRPDATGVRVGARGAALSLRRLSVWAMADIWRVL